MNPFLRAGSRGNPRRRINRVPSPAIATGMPWASIMLGSVIAVVLMVASTPLVPPLGFMLFLSWQQFRPGLLPIWAGLPLGLFDDLFSGQPFGTGVVLWSLAVLALDSIETRMPWRVFFTEWLVAAGMIAVYILACLLLANLAGAETPVRVIVPQVILSILLFPLVGLAVGHLDRIRLTPFVEID